MLILENEWLKENQVELSLIYDYDYDQSILISSNKNKKYNIQVSFYRLKHDPINDGFFIDGKINDITLDNRKEVKRFLDTVRMFSKQSLH